MNHQHQPDRARSAKNRLQRRAKGGFQGYPIATVAYYGPDNQFASKVAVGIVQGEGEDDLVDLKRWFSEDKDVRFDPDIYRQILRFVHRYRVKSVVIVDGIIGCPHEEGKDYPKGENCPHCPYWADRDRWTGELKGEEAPQPARIVTGCAWYRADQWDRLLEISVDRDRLGDSYGAWAENAEETLRNLQEQQTAGVTIEKVEVDVEEMLAWCRERGVEVDAEARAEYAADLLRRHSLGDESESF